MNVKKKLYGIWSIKTEGWVRDYKRRRDGYIVRHFWYDVTFDTKKEARADMAEWCIKDFKKDYEVREYEP